MPLPLEWTREGRGLLGNPQQTSPSEGLVGRLSEHLVRAVGKAEGWGRGLADGTEVKGTRGQRAAETKTRRWHEPCVCSSGPETRSEATTWGAVGRGTACYRGTTLPSFACTWQ